MQEVGEVVGGEERITVSSEGSLLITLISSVICVVEFSRKQFTVSVPTFMWSGGIVIVAVIFIEAFGGEQITFSAFWFKTLPFTSINPHSQEPL